MTTTTTDIDARLDGLIKSLRAISSTRDPLQIGAHAGRGIRQFVPFDALVSISCRDMQPGTYRITRRIIGNRASDIDLDPWTHWDRMPVHRGGIGGDLIGKHRPIHYTNLYLKDDPALDSEMARFGSCLAIPLFDGGAALNWNLVFRESRDGFTSMEIELITLVSNLLGQATRNMVTTRKVESLHARIESQLREVGALQRSLLPAQLPDIPGLEMAVSYQPSELAGGDYYDFTPLPDPNSPDDPRNPWGMIFADVAGHGARAAVVMAILQTLTQNMPLEPMDRPDAVLRYLNERFLRKSLERTFVTALCMGYDPRDRTLSIASAGHPPPRLKKPGTGAPVAPIEVEHSYPLGIDGNIDPKSTTVNLEVGDTVVVFTDGVTESFNKSREMFGLNRLDATIEACSGEPACIIESINKALAAHEQGRRPSDDQTILAFKVRA